MTDVLADYDSVEIATMASAEIGIELVRRGIIHIDRLGMSGLLK